MAIVGSQASCVERGGWSDLLTRQWAHLETISPPPLTREKTQLTPRNQTTTQVHVQTAKEHRRRRLQP